MQINVEGRIKNVNLPYSKPLYPLFEAVVNSIHAIEELNSQNGIIKIFIERDKSQGLLYDNTEFYPIKSFRIEDNGIGFNEPNYNAFLTADTTYKAEKGGKGIGRFLWLKAFEYAHIESTFHENGGFKKRVFDFVPTQNGIEHHELMESIQKENRTVVYLVNFDDKYRDSYSCPKKADTIAMKIIEHTLVYFLDENCPLIILYDDDKVNLNDLFVERIKKFSEANSFKIRNHIFDITHFRLYSSEESRHQIHYCADNREVKKENLSEYIPNLKKKLRDEIDSAFTYSSYISGKYLDSKVNTERTDFSFPDNGNNSHLSFDDISKEELTKDVLSIIREHLRAFLEKIQSEKIRQIETFVQTKRPQYRIVLKYENYLDEIEPDLSDDKLDIKLHEVITKIERELKEKNNAILKTDISKVKDLNQYKEDYRRHIEQVNELGKSRLAEHIIHRKLILDLLINALRTNPDTGTYYLEENIHEIIFPMKTTSDEITYEKQNLWIIDEKLAYHKYLASDIPLKDIKLINVDSLERPDIIIFNEPFAFAEDTPPPFSSVVVIEFKRPARKNYSGEDSDPVSQIYDYVRKIEDSKVNDINGRPINIINNTPFYGYIICDLTPKIRLIASNYGFTKAPDNLGYFVYNQDLKTYIEIISYDKLISDAKKRNQILFDKLFLPR